LRKLKSYYSTSKSTLYLSNAAKTTGFLVGRSLASNDAQDFFIYDVTAASTRLAIDSSGNVGIDATPSAWGSIFKSLDIRGSSVSSTAAGARSRAPRWTAARARGAGRS